MELLIDLIIALFFHAIAPKKQVTKNKCPVSPEWIIMDEFHADYEKEFGKHEHEESGCEF